MEWLLCAEHKPLCVSQMTTDSAVDCSLHLALMNRARCILHVMTELVLLCSGQVFPAALRVSGDRGVQRSRFLRPCQVTPAGGQVPPTAWARVGQVEALLRQVLALFWSQHFFHASQILLAQRWDKGMGEELGSSPVS